MGRWRNRITEALRRVITLKGLQWSQRFQWGQWFSGRAPIDTLCHLAKIAELWYTMTWKTEY